MTERWQGIGQDMGKREGSQSNWERERNTTQGGQPKSSLPTCSIAVEGSPIPGPRKQDVHSTNFRPLPQKSP